MTLFDNYSLLFNCFLSDRKYDSYEKFEGIKLQSYTGEYISYVYRHIAIIIFKITYGYSSDLMILINDLTSLPPSHPSLPPSLPPSLHYIFFTIPPGHRSAIKSISVLDSEHLFVSGSKDKTVKIWSLYNEGDGTASLLPRLTYVGHQKPVTKVDVVNQQNVVSCDGGSVHVS